MLGFLFRKKIDNFYEIFEEYPEATFVVEKGQITYANRKAEVLYRLDKRCLIGEYDFSIFRNKITKEMSEFEAVQIKKGGQKFYGEFKVANISNSRKDYFLVAVKDVTTKNLSEKKLKTLLNYKSALYKCSKALLKNGGLILALEAGLKHMLDVSAFTSCCIFQYFEKEKYLQKIIETCKTGIRFVGLDPKLQKIDCDTFKTLKLLCEEKRPLITHAKHLSEEEFAFLKSLEVRTLVLLPIIIEDKLWGFLEFDNTVEELNISQDIIDILQICAELVGFYILKKQFEDTLIQAKENLEETITERTQEITYKNLELENYVSALSHDVQTPIQTIDQYFHLLLNEEEKNCEKHMKIMGSIHLELHHILETLHSLIGLLKIGKASLNIQKVNLSLLFKQCYNTLLKLDTREFPEIIIQEDLYAEVDETLFRSVFENFISNSLKYRDVYRKLKIQFGKSNTGDQDIYFISDNGIGFNMESAKNLCKPFFRIHSKRYPGTGIGLSLVKKIILEHGGNIWFDSEPDRGTTFYFTLD